MMKGNTTVSVEINRAAPLQLFASPNPKKRGHSNNRSWIHIQQNGNSQAVSLEKSAIMNITGLPARDLRLLDPLFVYPSTILGRERAIVVSLEQIRCIIMADEVYLMNSLDSCVLHYQRELCQRIHQNQSSDDLPFEFKALELALELSSTSLDAQVSELENEIYPLLEELVSSISTVNLEHVRRLKGHLLALTYKVQKVRDEVEQLMDDDGDMAEMYLTEKKERAIESERDYNSVISTNAISKSAPVSPTWSSNGQQEKWSKNDCSRSSYNDQRRVEELEMLLEAYFVVVDHTLSKVSSLKEYIDDTEDFINIKLDNVRNQLIKFELLLTGATFVVTMFAVVTGVFGMNFVDSVFDVPSNFNLVIVISCVLCVVVYLLFLFYVKYKRLLPS